MKRIYFIAMLCMALVSCNNEEQLSAESNSLAEKELNVMGFSSEEKMEEKINEIVAIKSEYQRKVLADFNRQEALKGYNVRNKSTSDSDIKERNEAIYNSLKVYHNLVLSSIYELRKQLKFTSIQSIADEINSLNAVDPEKAVYLTKTYRDLLIKDLKIGVVSTIFDGRTSNVLNADGIVLINGKKMDYDEYFSVPGEKNNTRRYVRDEAVAGSVAAISRDYKAFYSAGREIHRNDFGVKFFRYFTELKTFSGFSPMPESFVECPSTFTVDPSSVAGFALSNTVAIGDYSFTYPYISGSGVSVRYTGGKINNAYVPVGGKLKATFTTTIGGINREMSCDLEYKEQ
ncbi:hypothetical protein [Flavobacterium chilense]|uniref:Uncharacterized protein n=1 Tax=Flavobacterium chilense TaxID=946677 RepID=A0A1M7L0N7_9FLAO|nr:hypothetical protein [Flavobacterium chilense]SHM71405.1 hypothetical protein SAMN05444484_108212 [Flavobacterium chilense]